MNFEIYTTRDLYAVMYDKRFEAPSNYWLNLLYSGTYMSTREEIFFEKITSERRIAPFALPTVQGKPIYKRQGSELQSFRPAYIKPKDAIRPVEAVGRQPGDLFNVAPRAPQQNFDAEVVRIMQFHRAAIWRRWEWMAARAAIDGQVTIESEDYPEVTVQFGRAANQTVALGAGARWGDAGVSILDSVQGFIDRMQAAPFGGIPNRLTITPSVWPIMRQDKGLLKQMDLTVRGNSELNLSTGLIIGPGAQDNYAKRLGTLGAGLEVWMYKDFYQNNAGAAVPFMTDGDVLLSAPGFQGVKAFGAIMDTAANLAPIDIFPKMWDEQDPSARFIMNQSAPLMIPVQPNCSLKATVVAP